MAEKTRSLEQINYLIHGVIKPAVTPFIKQDGRLIIDTVSQMRQMRAASRDGTQVFFATANAGEGLKLDWMNWQIAAQTSVAAAKVWGIPVVVGILRQSWEETIAAAKFAKEIGADAVVWAPVLTNEVLDQPAKVSELLKIDQPYYLYNNPKDFGKELPLEFIDWARKFLEIRGIKNTSGDENFFRQLLKWKQQGRFRVFQANTRGELAGIQEADGIVAMQANVAPGLIRQYFDQPSEELRQQVLQVCDWTHKYGLKGTKTWLVQQGIFATDLVWEE